MKTITKTYNVYTYNELSDEAKEKVKQDYLDDPVRNDLFYEDCMETIHSLFPQSDLKVQYSLSSCQGDGFNIYGTLDVFNMINLIRNREKLPISLLNEIEKDIDAFTNEELEMISQYYNYYCSSIKIPYNTHYCYSQSDYIDFADDWKDQLENAEMEYNENIIIKFEDFVKNFFSELNSMFEKDGYEFLYNVSEEEIEDWCEANEYMFLENGIIFN